MNLFNTGYYTEQDLFNAGFKSLGNNVRIAKNCNIVGLEYIEIGNNVRIDNYSSLIVGDDKGWIKLGSHIHIGTNCLLQAGRGIQLFDHSTISHGTKIFTRSDNYNGNYLITNPGIPETLTNVTNGPVVLKPYTVIGANCVILPNVIIGRGTAVGALSFVKHNTKTWSIYAGCPAKKIKERSTGLISLLKHLKD